MNKHLSFLISSVVFLVFLFFSTCKKEYSYEGGTTRDTTTVTPAVASFTLLGAPDNCTDAEINGSYVVGKPFTISNTVVINVNVTVIGIYKINTDTIDGIYFSASGGFAATGNQKVTLTGKGTPDVPQNLLFTPLSKGSECTFTLSVINSEPLATYVIESGGGGLIHVFTL